MNDQPLVTVNILSFNRKDELRNTLTKVFEQDYKNIEVIVVDNASSDGSSEMVKNEFPSVQLIQMQKNIGIAGWNEGFKAAKGEYVLVLDDDSYPDRNGIVQTVNILFKKNRVGIVAFNVFDKSRNIYETNDFTEPFKDFIGCGALIRKECIDKIGGFDSRFFIYAHETDFSIRTLNAGYLIDYSRDAIVFHRNITDPNIKPAFSHFRFIHQSFSYVILLKKYLPKNKVRLILSKFLINRLLVALYFNLFSEFYSLIILIFKNLSNGNNSRLEVKAEILELYGFNVELFNRYYFSRLLKNHSKFTYPFLYLKTLFNPLSEKNSMLVSHE